MSSLCPLHLPFSDPIRFPLQYLLLSRIALVYMFIVSPLRRGTRPIVYLYIYKYLMHEFHLLISFQQPLLQS